MSVLDLWRETLVWLLVVGMSDSRKNTDAKNSSVIYRATAQAILVRSQHVAVSLSVTPMDPERTLVAVD